jgi:neutral ceramidase
MVTSYRAGFSRREITAYEPGMAMLGWEHPGHKVRGVATPLFARALFLEDTATGGQVVLVVAELGFLTCAVRLAVLAALAERARHEPALAGLGAHNVALGATHTHSGPSGLSQFPMYNTTNRGFSSVVFGAVVAGIVDCIRERGSRGRARHPAVRQRAHPVYRAGRVQPLAAGLQRQPRHANRGPRSAGAGHHAGHTDAARE